METELDTRKMRACTYLLPDPGGEVVRSCLDEIERLRELLDSHFGSGWEDWDRASFMVMRKEIASLKHELEAARKDAERYRWLRTNCRYGFDGTSDPQLVHATESGPHANVFWREDLDAAIDSQMYRGAA